MSVRSALLMTWFIVVFVVCQALELELLRVSDSVVDSCVAVRCSIRVWCFGIRLQVLEGMDRVKVDEQIGDCSSC